MHSGKKGIYYISWVKGKRRFTWAFRIWDWKWDKEKQKNKEDLTYSKCVLYTCLFQLFIFKRTYWRCIVMELQEMHDKGLHTLKGLAICNAKLIPAKFTRHDWVIMSLMITYLRINCSICYLIFLLSKIFCQKKG